MQRKAKWNQRNALGTGGTQIYSFQGFCTVEDKNQFVHFLVGTKQNDTASDCVTLTHFSAE